MTISKNSMGLSRSPAMIASNGKVVLVGDRSGSILFWNWPKTANQIIKAHDDGGTVITVNNDFATTGGWDATVKRWNSITQKPRFIVKPFNAKVTALCAQNDNLIVAGANHSNQNNSKNTINKDTVFLQPSQLFSLDKTGKSKPIPIQNKGQIKSLACGHNWILAIDSNNPDHLLWIHNHQISSIQLAKGPATAIVARGKDALVADNAGIWIIDPQNGTRQILANFQPESLQVLSLVTIHDHVFSATSEGILDWPSGKHFSAHLQQPVAMTRHQDSLLVLWEGGLIEQLDGKTGKVINQLKVPQKP